MRRRLLINILLAGMLVQGVPVQTVYAEETGGGSDVETPEAGEQEQYRIQLSNAAITDGAGNVVGGRNFAEGAKIHLIFIPEETERDEFVSWNVFTESGNSVAVANDTFQMPAENVYVESEFYRYFFISITGGKADKQKAIAGETVSISLNKLKDNEDFQGWVSGTGNVSFADSKSTSTSFVMPVEDVTVTGKVVPANGFKVIDGKTYYFSNGEKATGWKKMNGQWYYFETSGVMVAGWKKLSNKWYYMNNKGVMQTGWITISGKKYYLDANGVMQTGWKKLNNKWYYLNSSGVMATGWQKIGSKWYYFDASGIMQTGWKKLSGKWYYLDPANGDMKTGWQKIGGAWYYLNTSGAMQTGWQKISNKWYYFKSSGAMATGWIEINSKWYYMNSSGAMLTGWQKIANKQYYFNSSGAMVTGWQKISNKWYYFNTSGAMLTGWNKIDGQWYYMNTSGVMLTGWQTIGGKQYYFKGSGIMAANEWVGDSYLTSSGAMQPKSSSNTNDTSGPYILNTKSMIVHTRNCGHLPTKNGRSTNEDLDVILSWGYRICSYCR